ncbi:MAG TPA: maleylpyruvate isomerase family mycothiol-dependent enzyme [Acidimicrobiales bacterium]|nr:maleylpyruvate isomerase family mycothiol-dependent enzyme [Acidimicrobiales bacterium]
MTDGATNLLRELEYALAEADALPVEEDARRRVLGRALSARRPGPSSLAAPRIGGTEAFARSVAQMDLLLGGLGAPDWHRRTIRGLDVQGLVGHLIGVERAFADAAEGLSGAAEPADHVASTAPFAEAQRGRPPLDTLTEWREATARSLRALAARADHDPAPGFYGISLPMDQLLVVRGFEIWVHHEDVRRATGRGPEAPDDAVLGRMTELAIDLLPAGLARAGRLHPEPGPEVIRLVLTGPGGGTWVVPLDGSTATRPGDSGVEPSTRLVLDAVDFCRVAGNRLPPADAGAETDGDAAAVDDLLVGAAALALD